MEEAPASSGKGGAKTRKQVFHHNCLEQDRPLGPLVEGRKVKEEPDQEADARRLSRHCRVCSKLETRAGSGGDVCQVLEGVPSSGALRWVNRQVFAADCWGREAS